ncbi:DUF6692 family protein [Qipengyuania atrilutea]|uniref:DUF6692 domain-containing protein n=1 Tax=Qipengyuania atrilutea TaxID=2744473 RepID=A0A850GZ49_9SPHN|nr:DUF6692 family protein [Actirhodobacter atriluteus]NVD44934.1 hypothetical protein [Actirhodobacter atriluteus]
MRKFVLPIVISLSLAACNENTALGNDREAQLDRPEEAAPIMSAAAALNNVSTAVIKPETMSRADLAAIGLNDGDCVFRLTEVSFPALVYRSGGGAVIKLNGKLIELDAAGPGQFASGDLRVSTRMLDYEGDAGLQGMEMIVVPPGAEDELGYHGFRYCRA